MLGCATNSKCTYPSWYSMAPANHVDNIYRYRRITMPPLKPGLAGQFRFWKKKAAVTSSTEAAHLCGESLWLILSRHSTDIVIRRMGCSVPSSCGRVRD